jgi:uncharacterized protein YfaS (alpha-2-macroglobulin family)
VAVADAGGAAVRHRQRRIKVTQDLQLLSGLPPLVRDGDRFSALLTLRNTTAREMKLRATLQGTANSGPGDHVRTPLALPPQDLVLAGRRRAEIAVAGGRAGRHLQHHLGSAVRRAGRQGGAARDRVKVTQMVTPAVPLRVLQATCSSSTASLLAAGGAPADALPPPRPQARRRGGRRCSPG